VTAIKSVPAWSVRRQRPLPTARSDATCSEYLRHETDINAPLDTVWQLHADVNAWPAWQTGITAAHIDGEFQPGASFEWTS
jgi:uncharacterized membrane protein